MRDEFEMNNMHNFEKIFSVDSFKLDKNAAKSIILAQQYFKLAGLDLISKLGLLPYQKKYIENVGKFHEL